MASKRPISPHLQIYNIFSKEMTSGLSIIGRLAGAGLIVGLIYFSAWLWCAAMGDEYYDLFLQFITSWFGYLSLFGFTLCFYYYLFNGIRFMSFAWGFLLSKKETFVSGVVALLFTVGFTAITWIWIFIQF